MGSLLSFIYYSIFSSLFCTSKLKNATCLSIFHIFLGLWFVFLVLRVLRCWQVGQLREVSNKVHNAELKLFLEVEKGMVTFIVEIVYFLIAENIIIQTQYFENLYFCVGFVSHCTT